MNTNPTLLHRIRSHQHAPETLSPPHFHQPPQPSCPQWSNRDFFSLFLLNVFFFPPPPPAPTPPRARPRPLNAGSMFSIDRSHWTTTTMTNRHLARRHQETPAACRTEPEIFSHTIFFRPRTAQCRSDSGGQRKNGNDHSACCHAHADGHGETWRLVR